MAAYLSYLFDIRGAFYRPPAKAILSVLPSNAPLLLRNDPRGEICGVEHDDPYAIAIFVKSSEIPGGKALESAALSCGFSADEILSEPEWHLGYVPREAAAKLRLPSDSDTEAFLIFDPRGRPQVTWTLASLAASPLTETRLKHERGTGGIDDGP